MKKFCDGLDLVGIKGVLVDLDNTLCDTEDYYSSALECCYQKFKKEVAHVSWEEFNRKYKEAQLVLKANTEGQASSHSRFIYFQILFEKYFGKTCIDLVFDFNKLYYHHVFTKAKLYPGVKVFLDYLKKKKIKVCILTDQTAQLQFEKIKFFKLCKYIDFVVSSEEAGVEKPHPRIFELALNKLDLKANEVLIIGDSQVRDIDGALRCGIKRFFKVSFDK